MKSQQTGYSRTNTVITRIVLWTINRGVIVTLLQISLCALFGVGPVKLLWSPVHLIISKVYTNTFIAMLNSRPKLRSYLENRDRSNKASRGEQHLELGALNWRAPSGSRLDTTIHGRDNLSDKPHQIEVYIQRQIDTETDAKAVDVEIEPGR